jgi:hypothetical protein
MLERFRAKANANTNAKDDLFELDDPTAVLKQEAYDDCLSCRVLGEKTSQFK